MDTDIRTRATALERSLSYTGWEQDVEYFHSFSNRYPRESGVRYTTNNSNSDYQVSSKFLDDILTWMERKEAEHSIDRENEHFTTPAIETDFTLSNDETISTNGMGGPEDLCYNRNRSDYEIRMLRRALHDNSESRTARRQLLSSRLNIDLDTRDEGAQSNLRRFHEGESERTEYYTRIMASDGLSTSRSSEECIYNSLEPNSRSYEVIDGERHGVHLGKDRCKESESKSEEKTKTFTLLKCVICLEGTRSRIFVPCGHLCICEDCNTNMAFAFDNVTCPVCRSPAKDVIKIYL